MTRIGLVLLALVWLGVGQAATLFAQSKATPAPSKPAVTHVRVFEGPN